MSVLAVKALNQFYGGSHTLWDVDLAVAAGLAHVPDGPQRHGQDHAAQVHHGPAADDLRRRSRSTAPICAALPAEQRATLGIGYVPQGREIFPQLTVEENLRVGLGVRKNGPRAIPRAHLRAVPGAEEDAEAGAAATCRAASSSNSRSAARWCSNRSC